MQSRALPHPHISARALCSHISEPSAKQKTEEKEIEEMAKRKVNFNTRIYRELLILLAHEMFSNCFTSFARWSLLSSSSREPNKRGLDDVDAMKMGIFLSVCPFSGWMEIKFGFIFFSLFSSAHSTMLTFMFWWARKSQKISLVFFVVRQTVVVGRCRLDAKIRWLFSPMHATM